jgi:hypothetical protein
MRGAALLVVLVMLLAATLSAATFIWFMNQQQTRSGNRWRAASAVAAAEAGVHRAMSILESVAPDGRSPGRTWRPSGYTETYGAGPIETRFSLTVTDEPDGALLVTSAGEAAGVSRRVRARVYLASPVLLTALHGASVIRFEEPPAVAVILPYGAGFRDRPWIHIAASQGIWFGSAGVSINDPSLSVEASAGPVDGFPGPGGRVLLPRPGPVRLLLREGAEMTLGDDRRRVDLNQLRGEGIHIEGIVLRAEALPLPPEVDRAHYQARAQKNRANAALHTAAGEFLGDPNLARKTDSVYDPEQFEQVLRYLRVGLQPPLFHGIIYIRGGLALDGGQQIRIAEGALVSEGTVQLREGAALEVTHSASTRTLPGVIVLDGGGLVVTEGAQLRVHGLVYASRVIDLGPGARAEIVGAAVSNDRGLSFRNVGATVVIRYDLAVLGTPGLRAAADAPIIPWIAAWEELP